MSALPGDGVGAEHVQLARRRRRCIVWRPPAERDVTLSVKLAFQHSIHWAQSHNEYFRTEKPPESERGELWKINIFLTPDIIEYTLGKNSSKPNGLKKCFGGARTVTYSYESHSGNNQFCASKLKIATFFTNKSQSKSWKCLCHEFNILFWLV